MSNKCLLKKCSCSHVQTKNKRFESSFFTSSEETEYILRNCFKISDITCLSNTTFKSLQKLGLPNQRTLKGIMGHQAKYTTVEALK